MFDIFDLLEVLFLPFHSRSGRVFALLSALLLLGVIVYGVIVYAVM